jgi:uncharacterized protein (DUF433 family)
VIAVETNSQILSGTPVFCGTRVPARILFEYLETGERLETFIDEFPSVSRELAVAALEEASLALDHAHPG